ncbi:MAG: hypothetical protein JW751_07615 [Polyangiaceae bacterium]|nr:hypothetical protein [Polyangiaceae bacterium]
MEPQELDREIEELELRVERLRSLYEQYFLGIEKVEPLTARKDVDRRIWVLRREQIRNTRKRFKLQTIIQRYNTYQQYWMRINREIEAGTYRRHLIKAQKILENFNPLTFQARKRHRMLEAAAAAEMEGNGRTPGRRLPSELPDVNIPDVDEAEDVAFAKLDELFGASLPPLATPPPDAPRLRRRRQPTARGPLGAIDLEIDAAKGVLQASPASTPNPDPESGRREPHKEPDAASLAPSRIEAPVPPAGRKPQATGTPGAALGPPPMARPPRADRTETIGAPYPTSQPQPPQKPPNPPPGGDRAVRPPLPAVARPPLGPPISPPITIHTTAPDSAPVSRPPAPGLSSLRPPPKPPRQQRIPPGAPESSPEQKAERARPQRAAKAGGQPAGPPGQLSDERVRAIHARLVEAKQQTSDVSTVSLEVLRNSLAAAQAKLQAQHGSHRNVDFEVVIKNGKAVLKPVVR